VLNAQNNLTIEKKKKLYIPFVDILFSSPRILHFVYVYAPSSSLLFAARLELDLAHNAIERLALDRRNLELERSRLAGAVSGGEGAGAPGRACGDV
jgi:hypothetical protein